MDVLDKYKETWKNQPDETNKVSQVDIYKMSHKKSTSIVKSIFIIGITELILSICSSFLLLFNGNKLMNIKETYVIWGKIVFLIILYSGTIYFMFHFYKNYKSISSSESIKTLISKILKTRKTVQKFIKFNFVLFFTIMFLLLFGFLYSINKEKNLTVMVLPLIIIFILIYIFLFVFFYYLLIFYYHLLYGRLLDKLYVNYNELSKLETE